MSETSPINGPLDTQQLSSEGLSAFVSDHWRVKELADDFISGEIVMFEGVESYILRRDDYYTKDAEAGSDPVEFKATHLYMFDLDNEGDIAGRGTVSQFESGYSGIPLNEPFVSNTVTIEGNQRQGLGRRRLLLANELSKRTFGKPVSSDLTEEGTAEAAASLWLKLVQEGKAEEFTDESGTIRWRFIG